MRLPTVAACGAMLLASVAAAPAQSVLVRVTAAESASHLAGVFVSLVNAAGRVERSGLTNDAGQVVLPVAAAGRFRVRAERIGRETALSDPFELRDDEATTFDLALAVHGIRLGEIRVEAGARCRLRPDEATEIGRVWDEARKALTVQSWAEREGLYRLEISTWERDLDPAGRRVERESRRGASAVTRIPFASLAPEDLAAGGFMRPVDDGGHEYYGPDARVLLSDAFLDTHCFRLTRSADDAGAIGLAFEPVRASDRADVSGTLWLDEETAALRFLEYGYTRAPYREAEGIAGGRVEFAPLPNGAWMIERWWIRAPLLARRHNLARAGDSGIRVIGIRETGGEVVAVSTLDRQRIARAPRGSVRGVVWDSMASAPLSGADVYLSGTGYRARSDDDGRFVLTGLPPGVFTATFTHPRLDSLGIVAAGTEVEVTPGRSAHVALAIPSHETTLVAACAAEQAEPGGVVLSGVVRDRATGEPVPGARVRIEWQAVERLRPVARARDTWIEVGTDARGRYAACGLPVDERIRAHASILTVWGAVAEAAFAEGGLQTLDLELELPARAISAAASIDAESGVQGVQGALAERGSERPVGTAEVTIRRLTGEVVASGLTNERGFFRLQTPAPGRYLLSALALGYRPLVGEVVDIERGRLTVLEIAVAPEALALEPLVVTAERRHFLLELEGFYRRQQDGFGTFITPEVFEQRQPRKVSDLLYGVPGTYVAEQSTGAGGRAVYFRSGIRPSGFGGRDLRPEDICWPMVYLDRFLVSTGGSPGAGAEPTAIDDLIHASNVWAIEVYDSPAEIPSEFNGPNAGCGVVVLWTRRGGGG